MNISSTAVNGSKYFRKRCHQVGFEGYTPAAKGWIVDIWDLNQASALSRTVRMTLALGYADRSSRQNTIEGVSVTAYSGELILLQCRTWLTSQWPSNLSLESSGITRLTREIDIPVGALEGFSFSFELGF